jgi:hypothetical protein
LFGHLNAFTLSTSFAVIQCPNFIVRPSSYSYFHLHYLLSFCDCPGLAAKSC